MQQPRKRSLNLRHIHTNGISFKLLLWQFRDVIERRTQRNESRTVFVRRWYHTYWCTSLYCCPTNHTVPKEIEVRSVHVLPTSSLCSWHIVGGLGMTATNGFRKRMLLYEPHFTGLEDFSREQ